MADISVTVCMRLKRIEIWILWITVVLMVYHFKIVENIHSFRNISHFEYYRAIVIQVLQRAQKQNEPLSQPGTIIVYGKEAMSLSKSQ